LDETSSLCLCDIPNEERNPNFELEKVKYSKQDSLENTVFMVLGLRKINPSATDY
jgi:hypothetical protein